jgi:hypothetical protein
VGEEPWGVWHRRGGWGGEEAGESGTGHPPPQGIGVCTFVPVKQLKRVPGPLL